VGKRNAHGTFSKTGADALHKALRCISGASSLRCQPSHCLCGRSLYHSTCSSWYERDDGPGGEEGAGGEGAE